MNETISVIIPAYNAEKYIEKTLESVLSQTYEDLELIIIDDGSDDNTFEECKKFSETDKRIKVYHKKNEGVGKARDFGISKATGEYITFVDSDDTIEPEMYQILLDNIKKYNADISHCGYKSVDSSNHVLSYFFNSKELRIQEREDGIIDLIAARKIEPGLWNKLYRKHLLNNLSYDSTMRINEDYVLNLYLFSAAKKSVFTDIPLYNYFQSNNSGSTKWTKEYYFKDILKAADITKNMFEDNPRIYPYAEKKWFKTYSDMYKNYYSYHFDEMEYDFRALLETVYQKVMEQFSSLKNNPYLNKSDKFILYSMKYCPKLLLFICKYR